MSIRSLGQLRCFLSHSCKFRDFPRHGVQVFLDGGLPCLVPRAEAVLASTIDSRIRVRLDVEVVQYQLDRRCRIVQDIADKASEAVAMREIGTITAAT